MMMAQGGVSLPAGYTKIEYLESDGTQFIDTGFKPNQNSRIKLDIQVTKSATSFLFGARVNSSANSASNSFSMPQISGTSLRMDYGSKNTSIAISPLQRLDIDVNKNVVTINGNVTTVPSQTFQSQYSLYLLSVNTAGTLYPTQTTARIYSCQIYDNGTLVRDFIPAMNASGKAGLYDLKNGVWYALLKPQVENKVSIYQEGSIRQLKYGIESQFPTASELTVSYRGAEVHGDFEDKYFADTKIAKGESKTGVIAVLFSSGSITDGTFQSMGDYIDAIIAVSPTEDDTYIYTF
jgi:hypothetical protein